MTRWATAGWLASILLAAAGSGHDMAGLREGGFVDLFDGESLRGWTPIGTDRFSVRDGVLVNDGGTGWLRADKPYKDFELLAEFRLLRKGSDSGVFFRATAESADKPPHWPLKGYQLQVIDGPGQFMLFGHGTPSRFDRDTERLASAMRGIGEWQSIRLKVVGNRAEASLNGSLIMTSDALSLPEGHVGLQGENGHLEWRALRIRELSSR